MTRSRSSRSAKIAVISTSRTPSRRSKTARRERRGDLFRAEMHEDAAEVLRILLDAVVRGFDLGLSEKPQHALLQRPGPFAGDDLDERCLLGDCLLDDRVQRAIDVAVPVVDVMKVEYQLHVTIVPSISSGACEIFERCQQGFGRAIPAETRCLGS